MLWLLFVKEIQIVSRCYSEDVIPRVPRSMENLSVKVQTIHADFVFSFSTCGCDSLMSQNLPQGTHVPRRFIAVLVARLSVKDPEEIVVRTSDDFSGKG